jgi:hypothetical protein
MQAYLSIPNAWIIRSAMHCNYYFTHLFDRTGSSCMFQIFCFFVRYIRSFICLLVKNNSNAAMLSGSYRCSDKKQISLVQSTPTAALWGPRTWASRVCIGGSCITHFQNNTKLEALGTQVSRNCACWSCRFCLQSQDEFGFRLRFSHQALLSSAQLNSAARDIRLIA